MKLHPLVAPSVLAFFTILSHSARAESATLTVTARVLPSCRTATLFSGDAKTFAFEVTCNFDGQASVVIEQPAGATLSTDPGCGDSGTVIPVQVFHHSPRRIYVCNNEAQEVPSISLDTF